MPDLTANSYGAKYADLLQRCKRIGDFHPDTKFKNIGDIWQAIYRRDSGRVPAAELLVGYLSEFIDNLADCSSGPSQKGVLVPFDLWDNIEDFIQGQVDVRDGADGPRPNRAMHLFSRIEQEVK